MSQEEELRFYGLAKQRAREGKGVTITLYDLQQLLSKYFTSFWGELDLHEVAEKAVGAGYIVITNGTIFLMPCAAYKHRG
jgi:hypothetical protein